MNSEEYRQINAISQSEAKLILKSDLHYFNRAKLFSGETKAQKLGTAFDRAVTDPVAFKDEYLQLPSVMPDGTPVNRRTKAYKELVAQIELENPTRVTLTDDEMDALTGMLNSLVGHAMANSLFQGGEAQVKRFDKWGDFDVKGMCDYFIPNHPLLGKNVLVELKTADDASPQAMERSVHKFGYDFQCAWYKRLFKAERVILVAVEKNFPYPIGCYDMEQWIPSGERKIEEAFTRLKALEERDGVAVGYTETITPLSVPSWVAGQGE